MNLKLIKLPDNSEKGSTRPWFVRMSREVTNIGKLTGTKGTTSKGYPYEVLDYISPTEDRRHHYYRVLFPVSGYIRKYSSSQIQHDTLKDPYHRIVQGVGCKGEVAPNTYDRHTYQVWIDMLKRCYDPSNKRYCNYGGRGIKVHADWLCFEIFLKDVKGLANYEKYKANTKLYSLDKDFLGGKEYSSDNCIFLRRDHNTRLAKDITPFIFKGDVYITYTSCYEKYKMAPKTLRNKLASDDESVRFLNIPDGYLLRDLDMLEGGLDIKGYELKGFEL